MNFIFLTYVNRSGSTYLANLLDSSPKILACPEGDMLVSFFLEDPGRIFIFDDQTKSRLIRIFSDDLKLQCWGEGESFFPGLKIANNNLEAFFTILINYKNQFKPGTEHILFKAERIVFLVRKILKVRTNHTIRFLSIIRDPRAVFASQKRTLIPEIKQLMSKNPVRTALFWKGHIRRSISESNQNKLCILKYEDLIIDYNRTIRVISVLLDTDLSDINPERGSLYKRFSEDHKLIHINVEKPPDSGKICEWENHLNKTEILKIDFLTNKILTKFGYKTKYWGFQWLEIFPIILPAIVYYYARKIFQKILFRLRLI
jgi:hypothetical protein